MTKKKLGHREGVGGLRDKSEHAIKSRVEYEKKKKSVERKKNTKKDPHTLKKKRKKERQTTTKSLVQPIGRRRFGWRDVATCRRKLGKKKKLGIHWFVEAISIFGSKIETGNEYESTFRIENGFLKGNSGIEMVLPRSPFDRPKKKLGKTKISQKSISRFESRWWWWWECSRKTHTHTHTHTERERERETHI